MMKCSAAAVLWPGIRIAVMLCMSCSSPMEKLRRRDMTSHAVIARNSAAKEAAVILGAQPPLSLSFPDQRLDSIPFLEIVQAIEPLMHSSRRMRYIPISRATLTRTTEIVARAVLTACRPQPNAPVKAIYAYEVLSATNWFDLIINLRHSEQFDVASQWPRKMAALQAYEREMRASPHARSYEVVEALARSAEALWA